MFQKLHGTHTKESVDYPDYAHLVAQNVLSGSDFGVLICYRVFQFYLRISDPRNLKNRRFASTRGLLLQNRHLGVRTNFWGKSDFPNQPFRELKRVRLLQKHKNLMTKHFCWT